MDKLEMTEGGLVKAIAYRLSQLKAKETVNSQAMMECIVQAGLKQEDIQKKDSIYNIMYHLGASSGAQIVLQEMLEMLTTGKDKFEDRYEQ